MGLPLVAALPLLAVLPLVEVVTSWLMMVVSLANLTVLELESFVLSVFFLRENLSLSVGRTCIDAECLGSGTWSCWERV
jgi:hypothetical protein